MHQRQKRMILSKPSSKHDMGGIISGGGGFPLLVVSTLLWRIILWFPMIQLHLIVSIVSFDSPGVTAFVTTTTMTMTTTTQNQQSILRRYEDTRRRRLATAAAAATTIDGVTNDDDDARSQLSIYDKIWLENYDALKEYHQEYCHCDVPQRYVHTDQRPLGLWVSSQRRAFTMNKLRQDRKELLEEIGFDFEPTNSKWQQRYDDLKAYRDTHGHCSVPRSHGSLSWFVTIQRNSKNTLSQRRKELLDEIGFEWTPKTGPKRHTTDKEWMEQYENLVSYYKEHGHFTISAEAASKSESLKSLRTWMSRQRTMYRTNRMQPHRKDLLDKINFPWVPEVGRPRS